MAALPTIKGSSVQDSGQTSGYIQVSGATPEAFGAGAGRALQGVGNALGQVADVAQKHALQETRIKQENDIFNVRTSVDSAKRDLFLNPETGILAQKGKNAFGAQKTVQQRFTELRDNTLANAPAESRTKLEQIFAAEESQALDRAAAHEQGEMQTYKADTQKGTMMSAMQDAYDNYKDPKAIDGAIQRVREVIGVNTVGMPPEMTQAAEEEAISGIHMSVLQRMASDDPLEGQKYYEAHKEQITGKDHIEANRLLAPAVDFAKGRQAGEQILGVSESAVQLFGAGAAGQAAALTGAVIGQESGGRADAESPAGAAGIMQVMPGTAREIAAEMGHKYVAKMDDEEIKEMLKTDPKLGIAYGQHYLSKQLKAYGGDAEAALIAYNAGPGVADKWLKAGRDDSVLPAETRAYYPEVLQRYQASKGDRVLPGGATGRMTEANWTLKNFRPEDLTAPTEGGNWVDAPTAVALDDLAGKFQQATGRKVRINEERDPSGNTAGRRRGTSDPKDNPHVGKSQHLHGKAFDIQVQGWSDGEKAQFLKMARAAGFGGVGFYGPNGHLHIDTGNARTWGTMPDWAKEAMAEPLGTVGSGADSMPAYDITTGPGVPAEPRAKQPTLLDVSAPALATYQERLSQIVDPSVRASAAQYVQVQVDKAEAAKKGETAAAKQSAWDHMLQGGSVSDIDPNLMRRLEPGYVASLREFEKAKAKGDNVQDNRAWQEISRTDPAELIDVDILEKYGARLDQSHIDKALDMQRDAVKAKAGDTAAQAKIAEGRSTSEILNSVLRSMNVDNKPEGVQLATRFDEALIAGEASLGKKLSAVEKQDILDKLVLARSEWGTDTPAYQIDRKELAGTKFVSDWETVQSDDQRRLVDRYSQVYGKAPDADTALDIYNRALVVFNGGPADGPDDEREYVNLNAARALGRVPGDIPPREMDMIYGRWLRSFLGY